MRRALLCGTLAAVLTFAGLSDRGTADEAIQFNRDIRPLLADKCYACHGRDAESREAELRLDTFEDATADRDGSRAIAPGEPENSLVWERISSDDESTMMPPPDSHKTLSAAEKDLIKRWIASGAAYQKHWAFEPPQKVEPPKTAAAAATPLDAFLLARLEKAGLKYGPEASRETLIRRVAFTLTGLPPTVAEVDAFVADKSPDAYSKMVDRYLASPRYGEEMGRHWLDVARYADTHGLHLDNERQMWAFRDYVVRAFNENKPFDQFTVEQLAGDQLPDATVEQLTATGFNRCNVTTSEGGSINDELLYRYAVDRASTTMQTWMGMTGGCAVCHDHKFDPITQKEFYQFYAFFNSAADPGFDGNALLTQPILKMMTPEAEKQIADFNAQIAQKTKELADQTAAVVYADPAAQTPPPTVVAQVTVWLDDEFPPGANVQSVGPLNWITGAAGKEVFSGARALKATSNAMTQHYYDHGAAPLMIPQDGLFFVHVWIDPQNPPAAVMLQFNKGGWNHRAVWGDYNVIPFGAVNTTQRVAMGPLPEAGKWVRLEVPAEKVGLKQGDALNGFACTQHAGTVVWDQLGVVGRSNPATDPSQSLLAWRKQAAGKDTPGAPGDVNALLKAGTDKALAPADEQKLRNYYFQNVCAATKPQLAPQLEAIAALTKQRDEFNNSIPSTFIFRDLPKPRDSFIMLRGQYDKPGEKVEPGTLAILPPLVKANPEGHATRLDLARWLVADDHPLTARVTVNRFWQQVFGVGLVKTSGDFGSQGEPPSHPELLDWLALDFRENGWDVKRLMRTLLHTAAFRQSAAMTPELATRDPENRLLARGPRFRLDAEQLRDNALFVSGLIDLTIGGKGVKPYQPPNIWEPVGFGGSNTRFYKQDTGGALYRRSLYTFFKRTAPAPFMVNFDAPNREQFCTRRERSNTPLQALQLMNDVQHFEAARALATRMMREGGSSPSERIAFGYRVVLGRRPTENELKIVEAQWEKHRQLYQADEASAKQAIAHGETPPPADLPAVELAAYTLVANLVLNLDETLNRN